MGILRGYAVYGAGLFEDLRDVTGASIGSACVIGGKGLEKGKVRRVFGVLFSMFAIEGREDLRSGPDVEAGVEETLAVDLLFSQVPRVDLHEAYVYGVTATEKSRGNPQGLGPSGRTVGDSGVVVVDGKGITLAFYFNNGLSGSGMDLGTAGAVERR